MRFREATRRNKEVMLLRSLRPLGERKNSQSLGVFCSVAAFALADEVRGEELFEQVNAFL